MFLACKVHAQTAPAPTVSTANVAAPARCLPGNDGYLRARLRGAINSDLDWSNQDTECTGAVRPDGGLRMRFTEAGADKPQRLVLVFGVAALREGQSVRNLPVNVTLIREGAGQFYSTQGDDKCTLDEVRQTPLKGIPLRERSYRVVVRGFCTEPARSVNGDGAVLISRFDYAGRIDFEAAEDKDETLTPAAAKSVSKATQP